ncbi:MAG: endonuclease III domain-containing protein [Candidatus Rokuibacteriota bacterium]
MPRAGVGPRRGLTRSSPLRRRLLRLYDRLLRRLGPQGRRPGRSTFEAVCAILTPGTARLDVERELRLSAGLEHRHRRAPSAARLAALVRRAGVDRLGARRLLGFLDHVERRHGGDLRRLLGQPAESVRDELVALPGIGAEAADAILLYAAGRPVFVVDQFTRRILSRHRIVRPDAGYDELQALLMRNLPRDPALFKEYHALLVRVGREYCRAVPFCAQCPLRFDLGGRPPRWRPADAVRAPAGRATRGGSRAAPSARSDPGGRPAAPR